MRIPKHTTDQVQPLDVTFNRQYKILANRINDRANMENQADRIQSRDGIINFQSLMWNQLSSPAYRDMIRYAWHSTDPEFVNEELDIWRPPMVNQIQFHLNRTTRCEVTNCTEHAFIRCSYCGKYLRFVHFLDRVCFHDSPNDFVEGRAIIPGTSRDSGEN